MFDKTYRYSVQAVTNVRYSYLSTEDVLKKFEAGGAAARSWALIAAEELRMSDELLVDLGQRNARGRIAAFLLRMMERVSPDMKAPNKAFAFPLRQQQFAELLGLTPVHVCRILCTFRRDGVCDISNGNASIFDLDQVRQMTEAA